MAIDFQKYIDIQKEKLVSFTDAPKHIPGRPHIATVHRFRLRGSHGVKLESIKVGGKRFTSLEAIQRFIDRTTAAADGADPQRVDAGNKSADAREKRLARVEAELQAVSHLR